MSASGFCCQADHAASFPSDHLGRGEGDRCLGSPGPRGGAVPTARKATRPRRGLTITPGQTPPATEQPPRSRRRWRQGLKPRACTPSLLQPSSGQPYSPQGPPSGCLSGRHSTPGLESRRRLHPQPSPAWPPPLRLLSSPSRPRWAQVPTSPSQHVLFFSSCHALRHPHAKLSPKRFQSLPTLRQVLK